MDSSSRLGGGEAIVISGGNLEYFRRRFIAPSNRVFLSFEETAPGGSSVGLRRTRDKKRMTAKERRLWEGAACPTELSVIGQLLISLPVYTAPKRHLVRPYYLPDFAVAKPSKNQHCD